MPKMYDINTQIKFKTWLTMHINTQEYVCAKSGRKTVRSFWLISHSQKIEVGIIYFPKEYIGKRVRLKIEVLE